MGSPEADCHRMGDGDMNIDVAWVAAIVAFSVGAYLGAAVMAALTRSGKNKAYQQGIAECPKIHEWGENTG